MKKIEKTKELTVLYSIHDPALDVEQSDLTAYTDTLAHGHLIFDGDPVMYYCRPLSRSDSDDIILEVSCMHPGDDEETQNLRANKMGMMAYNRACVKCERGGEKIDKYEPTLGSRVAVGLGIWSIGSINPT